MNIDSSSRDNSPQVLFRICQQGSGLLFSTLWRRKIVGAQNVPRTGAVILAPNHRSYIDPPLVGSSIWRSVHFMARRSLFQFAPFGWFISQIHAHPISRHGGAGIFRDVENLLRKQLVVVVFPEGSRMKTDELGPAKPGIGKMALEQKVPVVPVYIHNSGHALKLKKIGVEFGKPLYPENYQDYRKFADDVMARIKEIKQKWVKKA